MKKLLSRKSNKIFLQIIICLIIFLNSCTDFKDSSNKKTDGLLWFYKTDSSYNKTTIPTDIYTTLTNEPINSIFYDTNYQQTRWTDTFPMWLQAQVHISKIKKDAHYELIFNGVIGDADISLNNKHLGNIDNMFVRKKFDITNQLQTDSNILDIKFKTYSEIKDKALSGAGLKLPHSGREMIRLAGLFTDTSINVHYIPTGLWKPIKLFVWEKAYISDTYFETQEIENNKYAAINATIKIISDDNRKALIKITNDNIQLAEEELQLQKGENTIKTRFKINNPQLWWTYNLGNQPLYNLKTELITNKKTLSTNNTKIGIRKIRIDTAGNIFTLYLNDVPITLKIINYISSIRTILASESNTYSQLISLFKTTNANMIHVDANGIYEKNEFYEECDRQGILIWQDFMLPYKILDTNNNFIENIKTETLQISQTLRKHPSIAFWSGENYYQKYYINSPVTQSYSEADSLRAKQINDTIFTKILPNIIKNNTNSYYFNKIQFKTIIKIPNQLPEYPNLTLSEQISEQKNGKNYEKPFNSKEIIRQKLSKTVKLSNSLNNFIYQNNLYSNEQYAKIIEKYRFDKQYNGYICDLFQDCSPAISYSIIDYSGKEKGKFYAIRNKFKSILLRTQTSGNEIKIEISSDKETQTTVDLYLNLYSFDGRIVWRKNILGLNIKGKTSKKYFTFNLNNEISRIKSSNAVFKTDLYINKELYSEDFQYFVPTNQLDLSPPNIKQKIYKIEKGYIIELTTDQLAKNVFIYYSGEGILTNNYFDLIPGATKKIKLLTKNNISDNEFTIISYPKMFN